MQLRYILLSILLITGIGLSQQQGSVNYRLHTLENGFNTVQKDPILALVKTTIDTILSGIATINMSAEPAPDSVVVTYNHYETDPPSDTGKVIIVPLSDMKGFNYWIKWATSEQFEIKIGNIGYEAITSPIYFRYYAIVRRR